MALPASRPTRTRDDRQARYLAAAGFAERAATPIRFVPYLLTAFPLMILAIAISHVYVSVRYF
jgi:Na+/H+ antiporter NhaD/arsenite permease-like protein